MFSSHAVAYLPITSVESPKAGWQAAARVAAPAFTRFDDR